MLDTSRVLLANCLDKKSTTAFLSRSCFSSCATQFFRISVTKSFCSGLTIVKSLGLVDRRLIKRSSIFTNCLLNGFKNTFQLLFEVLGITDIAFVFAQFTRDDLILDKAKKNNTLVRGNAGDEKNLLPAGRKFIFLTNLIEVFE